MIKIGRWVLPILCHRINIDRSLDSHQVRGLDYDRIQCLIFAFSAPGESPSPASGNTYGATPNIRRDVISEVHRGVVKTQTMVYDIHSMLKSQQGAGGQPQLVSTAYTLSLIE